MNFTLTFLPSSLARNFVLAGTIALTLAGCGDNSNNNLGRRTSPTTLKTEVQKTQSKYDALAEEVRKSNLQILTVDSFLIALDGESESFRKKIREVQLLISTANLETIQSRIKNELDPQLQSSLATIKQLEEALSKDRLAQFKDGSGSSDIAQSISKTFQDYLSHLAGVRDLFLGMYNDTLDLANAKFQGQFPRQAVSSVPAPAPEVHPAPHRVRSGNPIVSNAAEGGTINGTVVDALTGAKVADAFVGFKHERESSDYFFHTQTATDGTFVSPALLPDTYYVDVKKDGYVISSGENVQVSRGQRASENFSLTPPVAAGVYRITLTWTAEKANAVADVDSYLSIPGVSAPLGFKLKGSDYEGTFLDHDETGWRGPETVTLKQMRPGTYHYYVNNYNVRGNVTALGNSDVRVQVYKGSQMINEFRVPPGSGITYEVFTIDAAGIHPVERYNDNLSVY